MIDELDLRIISCLRSNCRLSVQQIADGMHVEARDCRHRLAEISKKGLFSRYCSIIDPRKLDFHITGGLFVAARELDPLAAWLSRQPNINNLQLLHGEYDFYIEALFRDMRDMSQFYEELGNFHLLRLREYQLIEPSKENFLCNDASQGILPEPEDFA